MYSIPQNYEINYREDFQLFFSNTQIVIKNINFRNIFDQIDKKIFITYLIDTEKKQIDVKKKECYNNAQHPVSRMQKR